MNFIKGVATIDGKEYPFEVELPPTPKPPVTYPSGEGRHMFSSVSMPRKGAPRFVMTGEFRPPKKGEWYLSGALPHAYIAPNDLHGAYHIMREYDE